MRVLSKFKYVSALLLVAATAPAAHADMMLGGATNLVSGTQTYTLSFMAPTNGTVTMKLSVLPWPDRLSTLSVSATSASALLAATTTSTSDSFSFAVGGAGEFFAHVCGTAQGALQLGLYSLQVTFTPSAVPLPASALLLATGAGAMFFLLPGMRRRHAHGARLAPHSGGLALA